MKIGPIIRIDYTFLEKLNTILKSCFSENHVTMDVVCILSLITNLSLEL